MKKIWKLIWLLLPLSFSYGQAQASDLYSCKNVSRATLTSEAVRGFALFNDAGADRYLAEVDSRILQISAEKLNLGDLEFSFLGQSGAQRYYSDNYWGLVEVYDKGKSEVTLFLTRSNGFGDQRSNLLDVEMWFCNR